MASGIAAGGELRGKVVWVTGAGTGIGRAAADMFAKEGAKVALMGRRPEPLDKVAKAIQAAGGDAKAVRLDVADRAQVQQVTQALLGDWKRVDILVNNAGLNVPKRRLHELSGADWDQVVQVNLTGAFNMIMAVLPTMRSQKDGLIINVSSLAGKQISGLSGTVYTASKHGMVALSHSVNMEEWPHNIRSTSFCPAEVNTEILDKRPIPVPEADKARLMQPEDLAHAMRMLALMPARTCVTEIILAPTYKRKMQPGELGVT
jgi:NADP-dependent 3-hydroxy acid dehydrogenase YdfG